MADGRDHRGKETGRGSQSGSLWRGCRETRRFSRGCQPVGYGYVAPVYVEGYYGGYAVRLRRARSMPAANTASAITAALIATASITAATAITAAIVTASLIAVAGAIRLAGAA